MERAIRSRQVVRFGVFELDLRAGELRRQGVRIKLQGQPFQILEMLLEHPGELVTREELQQKLWADGSFVDYEQGLNIAIKKLRLALGDSADSPRFVETLARRGYRFIAPVGTVDRSGVEEASPEHLTISGPRTIPADLEKRAGEKKWKLSRLLWVAALLALITGLALWFHIARSGSKSPTSLLRIVPFTTYQGGQIEPAFSPDGNQVAFVWVGEKGNNADIYVQLIDGGKPLQLTSSPAHEYGPAWSPDGRRIAFRRRFGEESEIVIIPALGGPERKLAGSLAAFGDKLSWSPDGKFLALVHRNSRQDPWSIFLVSTETGKKQQVTFPSRDMMDVTPVFSPDGQTLAFCRASAYGPNGDIYLLLHPGAAGRNEPRCLTFDAKPIGGSDWIPDGSSLVFSSGRTGLQSLWRIPVIGGEPQPLGVAGEGAASLSVARHGNRLVYQRPNSDENIYRIPGPGQEAGRLQRSGSSPTRVISSTREESDPQFSPDGKKIAFISDRSGNDQIWVCDSDGSHPVPLTDVSYGVALGNPRWSPDGRQIAFDGVKEGSADVYVVSTEGGVPRRLTPENSSEVMPSWSRDGRWIYFGSKRSGDWQVWKAPSDGGAALQVTQRGGRETFESPDGQWLYFTKYSLEGIWRVPVAGGEESQELNQGRTGLWAVTNLGIFLLSPRTELGPTIKLFNFATHRMVWLAVLPKDLGLPSAADSGLTVSPDGRWIAFVQVDRIESDLVLVENFR